jgi:hypothetical protein
MFNPIKGTPSVAATNPGLTYLIVSELTAPDMENLRISSGT